MKLNKKTVISLIPKAVLLILLLVIINTQLTESVVTGTFEKGLVFSILALGIFISFRILDIPDLSELSPLALQYQLCRLSTATLSRAYCCQ